MKFDGGFFQIYLLLVFVAVFVRALVATFPYSGFGKPPMHGDYEAQRHWMEITFNLPVGDWYRNTDNNDLNYWGLDYPPLTAYFSLFFGYLGDLFVPELIALNSSHGFESPKSKFFMRFSVLICDIFIVMPIFVYLFKIVLENITNLRQKLSGLDKNNSVLKVYKNFSEMSGSSYWLYVLILLFPSLLLIDHGHFQYNGISLSLTMLSVCFLVQDRDILASIFFTLSLNYKQMILYYSPILFFTLLGKCVHSGYKSTGRFNFVHFLSKLLSIGLTVIFIFFIMWFPFCLFKSQEETCGSSLLHVLSRQFPFKRGIFEDKVGNLWYLSSVIYDYRFIIKQEDIIKLSIGLTLLLISPACYVSFKLFTNKTSNISVLKTLLSLGSCSLAFFLASYQVRIELILFELILFEFFFILIIFLS